MIQHGTFLKIDMRLFKNRLDNYKYSDRGHNLKTDMRHWAPPSRAPRRVHDCNLNRSTWRMDGVGK